MTKTFWKAKLLPFLDPHPDMGEDVFGLNDKARIAFWFDGGLKIIGTADTLSLNFKDQDLLILATLIRKTVRIYRVPYPRLVCVELIHEGSDGKRSDVAMHFSRN